MSHSHLPKALEKPFVYSALNHQARQPQPPHNNKRVNSEQVRVVKLRDHVSFTSDIRNFKRRLSI